MRGLLVRAIQIYREEGHLRLLKRGFRFGYETFVRSLLPKTTVSYNEVRVLKGRVGDSLIPWREEAENIPSYEDRLIQNIREHAKSGDQAVIVGGGWGVSTVAAARRVGNHGSVITFEGSENAVKTVEETVRLNNVSDYVTIHHAIVSRAHSLRGEKGSAPVVSPDELPDCDILILDCEGAETEILGEMDIHPRVLVVETHGMLGATEQMVREKINWKKYRLVDRGVAEERQRKFCEENGIYVLTALNKQISPEHGPTSGIR